MGILVKKPGVLDTVQDLGRFGFRKLGINPGGAMDRRAVRLINIILQNHENEAVLELHFPASQFVFEEAAVFAIGGAEFGAILDKNPVANWKTHQAIKGSVLRFSQKVSGNRCYLGVKSGFKIEKWLKSASTNLAAKTGGFDGRKLEKDDKILFNKKGGDPAISPIFQIAVDLHTKVKGFETIRITKGIEYRDLTALSEQRFFEDSYQITNDSNRMGFKLGGNTLHLLARNELLSSAVGHGTIQLPPNGKPVILMADHQTTGGYPRIAHIIKRDLSVIGQMGSGDRVRFKLVSLEEAEKIDEKFERDLDYLRMGVKFKQSYANN